MSFVFSCLFYVGMMSLHCKMCLVYVLCSYNLQELSATLYFVMGALAKMAATFVTYPIQLVQSRLRVFVLISCSIFLS